MTAKTRAIKTKRLYGESNPVPVPNTNVYDKTSYNWSIDDDITLVGVEVTAFINARETITMGEKDYIKLDVLACRDAEATDNNVIAEVNTHLLTHDITIGVSTFSEMDDQTQKNLVVMFPSGYGIDFNRGDNLWMFMNATLRLKASSGVLCSLGGITNFYYVER